MAGETTDPARRHQYEETWSFICGGRYSIDDVRVDPLSMPASQWQKLACSRVAITLSGLDYFRPHGLAYSQRRPRRP